jgi:hypothetical protein
MEHDYMDVGVRVVPGATTELPRMPEPRQKLGAITYVLLPIQPSPIKYYTLNKKDAAGGVHSTIT